MPQGKEMETSEWSFGRHKLLSFFFFLSSYASAERKICSISCPKFFTRFQKHYELIPQSPALDAAG